MSNLIPTVAANRQIGVFQVSIVYGLHIIQISAKFMHNKLIPYQTKLDSLYEIHQEVSVQH